MKEKIKIKFQGEEMKEEKLEEDFWRWLMHNFVG
jgi:hypothetical protein